MGEFSERRRGFGGQSLTVKLMSEEQILGEHVDNPPDPVGGGRLNDIFNRALQDPSFTHIRLIDEYGTTIFNVMQLMEVGPELERLRDFTISEEEKPVWEEVIELARQVKGKVHHFLVFLGD